MAELPQEVRDIVHKMCTGEQLPSKHRDAGRIISGHFGVRKDSASGSLIVAWFPYTDGDDADDAFAQSLAVPGGVPVEELHLTLLYLGAPELYDIDLITAAVKIFSATYCWGMCLSAKVGGFGRFIGDGNEDVFVALVDCEALAWYRQRLIECLEEVGIWAGNGTDGHGYIPHITLAYIDKSSPTPSAPVDAVTEFSIDSVAVAGIFPDGSKFRNNFDFPGFNSADELSAAPFYAARNMVAKAGRVLSAKNLSLVNDCMQMLQKLADAARKADAEDELQDTQKAALPEDVELEYQVTKSVEEDRYTFGPLYAPMRKDAHGEYTDAETLQKAVWEYVRESSEEGRRINLQHDDSGNATCGEWLEIVAWPYETTIKVRVPGEDERELTMPAGTVYLGVKWDEPAWELVKSRQLTGYSLGGRAVRASFEGAELDHMGDKLAARTHPFEMDDTVQESICKACGKSMSDGDHTPE